MRSAGQGESNSIHLNLLDGFVASKQDGSHLVLKNRKACGVLAYLALNPAMSETRERLAGLLWSDRSEEQARASLRQSVKQLKTALSATGSLPLVITHQAISIRPGQIKVDLAEISDLSSKGIVHDDLLYGHVSPERILYGFETLDASYSAWLYVVRRKWHDRLLDLLLANLRRSSGSSAVRKRAAQALIKLDHTHEEAHRFLISDAANNGNLPAALRLYEELWTLLGDEYDTEPSADTQELIVRIKTGDYGASTDRESPVIAPNRSSGESPNDADAIELPVLIISDFQSGELAEQQDRMIGSFRRDLIASLIRFRDWAVVDGAGTSLRTSLPVDENGSQAENSHYRIDGSYFRYEEATQLVLTLMRLDSGRYIWSERFDLSPDTWSAAQRQIVTRMSAGLNIEISAQRAAQQIVTPDTSVNVYDLWLRAYRLVWSWDPPARQEAELLFRQVIDRCPSFAPAYSGLASIYSSQHVICPGVYPDRSKLHESVSLAQESVVLDPLDVRSQISVAWANGMIGRFDQSELHHRLAYELNPNNPTTLFSCANGLSMCGDIDSGVQLSREALRISPIIQPVQWAYLASTRFICGDYEGCCEAAKGAGTAIPMAPGWRAAALGQLGLTDLSKAAATEFLEFMRRHWVGSEPFSDSRAIDWFLQHCPLKQESVRKRAREGLARAGLPVPL